MGVLSWLGLESEPEKDPIEIDDTSFVKTLKNSKVPVVIDVWSDNCPHCHKLVPTIKKLTAKYEDRALITHMNISTNPKSAGKLRVKGTPTVVIYDGQGREYERVVGVRGQHFYEEILNEMLPAAEDTEKVQDNS